MCVVERRIYLRSDGSQRIVETTNYCRRAVGSRICKHVVHREVQRAEVVETRPSTADNAAGSVAGSAVSASADDTPRGGFMVTEGRDGRQRVYRDLSKRSSNSSSIRRSNPMSDRSSISPPSSTSSPPLYAGIKSTAPSPPSAFQHRYQPPIPSSPTSPPEPTRFIAAGGTAIYDRPPSLELPRARDNERPSSSRMQRPSDSSMRAEVDDSEFPGLSDEFPGPSRLPRVGSLRRNSGKEVRFARSRADSDRDRRTEQDRRRTDESDEDRQARIERGRLDESNRRQSAREELAREASRERHRQAAAEALEGPQRQRDDPVQRQIEAEYAQMARERAAAEARHSRSPTTARPPSRRSTVANEYSTYTTSPISARSSTFGPPVVHQYPSARHSGNIPAIPARGEEVIAREQARAVTVEDPRDYGNEDASRDGGYYVASDDGERRWGKKSDRRPRRWF